MWASIVIPAYNAVTTLDEAIASVHAQTVQTWEVVVVDDGSTDDTARVAERWAARDPRISTLRQPNGGPSAARNAGIRAARHDWLVFLDADDWLAPDFLRRMLAPLRRDRRLDGVFCRAVDVTRDGDCGNTWLPPPRDELFPATATNCPIAIHCALVRRRLIESVGLWDTGLITCEDWDLWQRLARSDARFAVVKRTLAFIRLRTQSLSRTDAARLTVDGLVVLRRGHARDPRVPNPDTKWAEGLPAKGLPQAMYKHVAWTAGVYLAQGGDSRAVLQHLPEVALPDLDPYAVAFCLHNAVSHSTGRLPRDWPAQWPALVPRLRVFLTALEHRSQAPHLAGRTLRHLEDIVLRYADLDRPVTLGAAHGISIEVTRPIPDITAPAHVERLVCRVAVGGRRAGAVTLPALDGKVPGRKIADAIVDERAAPLMREYLRLRGKRDPWLWVLLSRLMLNRRTLRFVISYVQMSPPSRADRLRALLWATARQAVPALGLARAAVDDAEKMDGPTQLPDTAGVSGDGEAGDPRDVKSDEHGQAHWDDVFSEPDPWRYTSEYEQTKYRQTLELLPPVRIRRALELACAEGHFTVQLAPRVEELTAADISEVALKRARERCVRLDNVAFMRHDLSCDPIPGRYDLMVCSEVLYYLERRRALRRFARRLAEHLEPCGWLLMAHANVAAEAPDETGFDWGNALGARCIGEVFASTPPLRWIKELRTPLYRIQLFQHAAGAPACAAPAEVIELPLTATLDYEVAAQVQWHGCARYRQIEVTDRLPILMYHRVAPAGATRLDRYRVTPEQFGQQLRHLQSQGYYGVDLERWRQVTKQSRGLPGRAVMITFDDGYEDFYTHAWPQLSQCGFPATVFLVTGQIGGRAEWDGFFGEPAPPLMSWPEIRELAEEGVAFGSHTVDHPFLTTLTPKEIAQQGAASREALEQQLGEKVTAMAYPYGDQDPLVRRVMADCGYEFGLTAEDRAARVADRLLSLPRIEVSGSDDLTSFAAKLERPLPCGPWRSARLRLEDALPRLKRAIR